MDVAHLANQLWPTVFNGAVIAACIKLWFDARKDRREAEKARVGVEQQQRTDILKIAQEAAAGVIEDLREDVDRERKLRAEQRAENERISLRLEKVEREFAEFRKVHDMMIADKDAELTLLRGENRQLKAVVDAYERLLSEHNIPHRRPALNPIWEVSSGEAKPIASETTA